MHLICDCSKTYPGERCRVFIKSLLSSEMANSIVKAQLFGLFKMRKNNTEHQSEMAKPLSRAAADEVVH